MGSKGNITGWYVCIKDPDPSVETDRYSYLGEGWLYYVRSGEGKVTFTKHFGEATPLDYDKVQRLARAEDAEFFFNNVDPPQQIATCSRCGSPIYHAELFRGPVCHRCGHWC